MTGAVPGEANSSSGRSTPSGRAASTRESERKASAAAGPWPDNRCDAPANLELSSSGVSDYLKPEVNGRLMPPRDPAATAAMIQAMYDERGATETLGAAGRAFAFAHCTERNTVDYVKRYLAAE